MKFEKDDDNEVMEFLPQGVQEDEEDEGDEEEEDRFKFLESQLNKDDDLK